MEAFCKLGGIVSKHVLLLLLLSLLLFSCIHCIVPQTHQQFTSVVSEMIVSISVEKLLSA